MSFDNASLEQLAELYNLITDDNLSVNETLFAYDNNEEQLREDNFNGMTEDETKDSAKMHKINVNIYKYDNNKHIYDIDDQWFFDNNYPTFSAVLYSTEDIFHVMYVSDAEKLTKILIYPKCKSHIEALSKDTILNQSILCWL